MKHVWVLEGGDFKQKVKEPPGRTLTYFTNWTPNTRQSARVVLEFELVKVCIQQNENLHTDKHRFDL